MESEHDNLRAALGWALSARPIVAWRLATALEDFWYKHGHLTEGEQWLARARALRPRHGQAAEVEAYAKLLATAAHMALMRGDYASQRSWLKEAISLRQRQGPPDEQVASLLYALGNSAAVQGDLETASRDWRRAAEVIRRLELSQVGQLSLLPIQSLGLAALEQGRVDEAASTFAEMATMVEALNNNEYLRGILMSCQGQLDLARGELKPVSELFRASLGIFLKLEGKVGISQGLRHAADVAEALGRPALAAQLLGASDALAAAIGFTLIPMYRRARDRLASVLERELGERAFRTGHAAGAGLSLEEAVNLARAVLADAAATAVAYGSPLRDQCMPKVR